MLSNRKDWRLRGNWKIIVWSVLGKISLNLACYIYTDCIIYIIYTKYYTAPFSPLRVVMWCILNGLWYSRLDIYNRHTGLGCRKATATKIYELINFILYIYWLWNNFARPPPLLLSPHQCNYIYPGPGS